MAGVVSGDSKFGPAKWIVSANISDGATHTTIGAAITSASSGDTIFVRDGTYTENLILKAGINIVALTADSNEANVTIIGKATFTGAGAVAISNIRLQTNSDFLLAVTGSAASVIRLFNCYLNGTNNTSITFTSSNSSANISIVNSVSDLTTTGIAHFSHSSSGGISVLNSVLQTSGGSTTASTVSAGSFSGNYSIFTTPITISGAATCSLVYCEILTTNVTAITFGGGAGSNLVRCYIQSGTASAVSMSTALSINESTLASSNTNAITGAGTLSYESISYPLSFGNNVTTLTRSAFDGGQYVGTTTNSTSAGTIGEQIRSAIASPGSTLTSPNALNVTSISLTPGLWDVNGIVNFTGITTGTIETASISTTSATIGTQGDNAVSLNQANTTNADVSLVIPAYRISLAATTTVYLVAQATFSGGTGKAYGRISGTRVA